jgi:hypothetical protein
MGTDPSRFLAALSGCVPDARRLLSRSLSDAARLLSSPLAGVPAVVDLFGDQCLTIAAIVPVFRRLDSSTCGNPTREFEDAGFRLAHPPLT